MGSKNTAAAALNRLPAMPGSARKAKDPRQCECGCGGWTKGGRFIPGHDGRRLGWAIRIHRGYDVEGITPGELKAAKAFIKDNPDQFRGESKVKPAKATKPARKPIEPKPATEQPAATDAA